MKILKRIGLAILGIIVLVLVVALFVKKEYRVEKNVVVNKSKQEVFDYVKYVKNQNNYNKWAMADPNAKKDYRGIDGTVGFIYAWDGNNKVGKGEQQIRNIEEGKRVDFDLHFIKPLEGKANAWITTESVSGDQTKIKWGMHGRSPYPLNIMNLFVPAVLGKELQTSLDQLKTILEK